MSNTQIYVVNDGMGSQFDSAWLSQDDANKRAAELNKGANETLGWQVSTVTLH